MSQSKFCVVMAAVESVPVPSTALSAPYERIAYELPDVFVPTLISLLQPSYTGTFLMYVGSSRPFRTDADSVVDRQLTPAALY